MPTGQNLRLVIDTDTASDDAVALLMAALCPGAEILAVTTVAGNVPLAQGARNALYTLQVAGRPEVPVYGGCDRPVLRPYASAQHVHGQDGMGDTGLPEPAASARQEHAVDVLLELANEPGAGSVTLVTLGPLTNIAAALLRDRRLLEKFRHTYCMAGAADCVGNVSPTAEYNVWADPEAASVVLSASTAGQVTFVGWDVSRNYAVMTPADQEAMRALGTPLALFANDINQAVSNWTRTVTGLAGYDLPDPIAMAVALDPSVATESEGAAVRVSLDHETRGQLVIDRRPGAEPNVTLVRAADEKRFKAMLFGALGRPVSAAG